MAGLGLEWSREPSFGPAMRALGASFRQQWRQLFVPSSLIGPVVSAAGPGIVLGYVAGRAENPTALSYVFVGAALSMIWNLGIFRTGWSLANEHSAGTLDLLMTTRTPLALVMLGKALAISAFAAIGGVVAFLLVLAVAGQTPPIAGALLFLASGCCALVAVIALCFVFAPFSFIAGVRGGFFNALMPFGSVVSGFLYPIGLLPASLEAIARLLPSAWAMQALVGSIEGGTSRGTILLQLGVSLSLSAALLLLAGYLFGVAERRVRLSGNLGSV
jgi:ABC-type multidrug transport system permease subunit